MHLLLSARSRSSRVVRAGAAASVFAAGVLASCHAPLDIKKFQGTPDKLYVASLTAFKKHHWDDAVAGFEKLTLDLPAHDTLLAQSYFYLGEAHEHKVEPLLAAQGFSRLAEAFPDDSLAPPALFAAGHAYEKLWRRPDLDATYGQSALSEYQTLLALYPASPLKDRAEARWPICRSGLPRRTTTTACTTTTARRTTRRSSTSRTSSRTIPTCR